MPEATPQRLPCPWLGHPVDLPTVREISIERRHPDLLPRHRAELAETLADPDLIRRGGSATSMLLFSRAYADADADGGRRTVVVVVDGAPRGGAAWIVTAYTTGTLAGGQVVWRRD